MLSNEKISGGQLISIMFWTIMGTAIISLPVLISIHEPRNSWMAAVIFIVGGLILCLIIKGLSNRFSNQGFVSCMEKVFGLWIGKILAIVFFSWMFHTTSLVIWQASNFTKVSLLPNTPLLVIILLLILPSVYAIYGGIERIARSGQFVFILTIGILFLLFLLNIPDADFTNLLPLLDNGIVNVLRSSLAPLAWAGEIMFVLFFLPQIEKPKKTGLYSGITIILIGIGGIINELFYTAVFGSLRQHLTSPFYSLVRYIRPGAFIERYDILFVSINLAGNFVKLAVFLYILALCLSGVLKTKSHRPLIIPITTGVIIFTYFTVKGQPQLINFLDKVFPFYTIPLLYGIPFLTLMVAKLRKILK